MEKETYTYRRFEIGRGEHRVPFTFAVRTDADGRVQVTRISPYDETAYHWALKSANCNHWRILRNGKTVSTIGSYIGGKPDEASESLSPEQIAYFLIKADMNARLEPRICRN